MHLLNMGGYAVYVWSAYGITLIVLGVNVMMGLYERKKIKNTLKK